MLHHADSDALLRQRAVALAIALTANTPLAPQRYEQQLLKRYEQGALSIDEVLALLEKSCYHVVYRSRETQPMTEQDLDAILAWSRDYNKEHEITGMLLYSDGQFVQVIEGREEEVRQLFAQIQFDTRHTQLVTVSEGPSPARAFQEWSMGFGIVNSLELDYTVSALETQLAHEMMVDDPNLRAVLEAFTFPLSAA